MQVAGGIWLEPLGLNLPCYSLPLCRLALTLTDLSYMLWYYTTKKEKAGFEIQDYSIKVTPPPIFMTWEENLKEAEYFLKSHIKYKMS